MAPAPTYDGVQPASPTTLHTEWASVETEIGLWPRGDKGVSSKGKLAIGLGLGIGGGGIVLCFLIYWWIRRRHRAFKDVSAFQDCTNYRLTRSTASDPTSRTSFWQPTPSRRSIHTVNSIGITGSASVYGIHREPDQSRESTNSQASDITTINLSIKCAPPSRSRTFHPRTSTCTILLCSPHHQ